jgi:DNA-binding transcriptional MerR regulator
LKVKVTRIGDLAKLTGVSTSTIRFYEARGLLAAAARVANGYRDYDRPAVEVVKAPLSASGAAG